MVIKGLFDLVYTYSYGLADRISIEEGETITLYTTYPDEPFYECENQLMIVHHSKGERVGLFYSENECGREGDEENIKVVQTLNLDLTANNLVIVNSNM